MKPVARIDTLMLWFDSRILFFSVRSIDERHFQKRSHHTLTSAAVIREFVNF